MINYGGSKISPAEIEDLALGYEHIDDVAYTSIKDLITGELPVILVVQKDGYEEADFESFLADRLESYKLPRKYIYVESIPKTFKGSAAKGSKKACRAERIDGLQRRSYKGELNNERIY